MSDNVKKKKLLVASTNKKKLKELQDLLADLDLELLCLADLEGFEEVAETGKTFEENAILKALGYAEQTGYLTLGEDSGLCCDALEDAPGIYSARFAGPDKSDEDNNEKLLRLLGVMPDNCRGAHYTSAVAIAEPEKVIGTAEGSVYGSILKEPQGEGGFGYDPLFFYPPFKKTFAEVPAEMKHEVSHRSKSLKKIKAVLENYLDSPL